MTRKVVSVECVVCGYHFADVQLSWLRTFTERFSQNDQLCCDDCKSDSFEQNMLVLQERNEQLKCYREELDHYHAHGIYFFERYTGVCFSQYDQLIDDLNYEIESNEKYIDWLQSKLLKITQYSVS